MQPVDPVRPDFGRIARTGVPEVILAEGKADEDLIRAIRAFLANAGYALVSRLGPERAGLLREFPHRYHPVGRIAVVGEVPASLRASGGGRVGILAAGTSDRAIAEEVAVVAEALGCSISAAYDVGVAGVHRLIPELSWARECDVLVCLAGREGTLPTLVAGLVDVPVVGVPVSTGYGHGGRGEAALASMLQSCAPLLVVNIDGGVVAGLCAARIARRSAAQSIVVPDNSSTPSPSSQSISPSREVR
ncbi:MAG: nickel pincer cofactor biosynthesis protein LarB [Thermoplasmatota archaeon]